MSLAMPPPDQAVLARRERIVAALRAIVPGEGVIAAEREMRPYEADGLTAYRQLPMVVVLPETTEQVSRVLAFCHSEGIKVVPRGAGTSLSGGALPLADFGTINFSSVTVDGSPISDSNPTEIIMVDNSGRDKDTISSSSDGNSFSGTWVRAN